RRHAAPVGRAVPRSGLGQYASHGAAESPYVVFSLRSAVCGLPTTNYQLRTSDAALPEQRGDRHAFAIPCHVERTLFDRVRLRRRDTQRTQDRRVEIFDHHPILQRLAGRSLAVTPCRWPFLIPPPN